jgi:hypothetical protein
MMPLPPSANGKRGNDKRLPNRETFHQGYQPVWKYG